MNRVRENNFYVFCGCDEYQQGRSHAYLMSRRDSQVRLEYFKLTYLVRDWKQYLVGEICIFTELFKNGYLCLHT